MSVQLNGHAMRERIFSTSPFQLQGMVWSCAQLIVIYLFILCLVVCAKRRKVVYIWTPDFLSSVALISREKKRRMILLGLKKSKELSLVELAWFTGFGVLIFENSHWNRVSNSIGKKAIQPIL